MKQVDEDQSWKQEVTTQRRLQAELIAGSQNFLQDLVVSTKTVRKYPLWEDSQNFADALTFPLKNRNIDASVIYLHFLQGGGGLNTII